ncbi:hypothetical protein BOSP111201_26490 [Bordetella sputigena]
MGDATAGVFARATADDNDAVMNNAAAAPNLNEEG